MNLTKNFTKAEVACPCCGECEMDMEFMNKLQIIRSHCGFGFKINSGYRCEKYNAEVSSNSMGDHARGLAVDVSIKDRYKRAKLLNIALNIGYFADIAIDKTFIHLGRGKTQQGVGVY